jgi:hypothetical protein
MGMVQIALGAAFAVAGLWTTARARQVQAGCRGVWGGAFDRWWASPVYRVLVRVIGICFVIAGVLLGGLDGRTASDRFNWIVTPSGRTIERTKVVDARPSGQRWRVTCVNGRRHLESAWDAMMSDPGHQNSAIQVYVVVFFRQITFYGVRFTVADIVAFDQRPSGAWRTIGGERLSLIRKLAAASQICP